MNTSSPLPRLRWGVIGTTGFADAIFAPVLVNAGQEIVGAVGSDADRSREFAVRHGCARAYGSVEELLRDPAVEAVWVASPNYLHAEQVAAALKAGKHVLAEKPLATSSADARRVVELALGHGLRLAVGFQGRFHRANRDLHALIRRGELGSVAYLRASWQVQYGGLPGAWRLHPETSGGWSLMDIGTHTLDAALWLTDFPEARLLGARVSTQFWPVEVDDLAVLLLQLGETTAVVETATGVQAPPNRIEVHGTGGWAVVTDAFVPRLGPAGGRLTTSYGLARSYDDAPNPYEAQVLAFAAWTTGGDFPGATGEEAAIGVGLLEEARTWRT